MTDRKPVEGDYLPPPIMPRSRIPPDLELELDRLIERWRAYAQEDENTGDLASSKAYSWCANNLHGALQKYRRK